VQAGRAASLAALLVWCAVLPVILPRDTFQFTIVLSAGFAGFAVALLLEAGLLSFGHALFYGIGGYTVAALSPLVSHFAVVLILAGAIAGAVTAVLTGLFVVRYRGVFFAMLNLAMAMVAYSILLKSYNLTGGSDGLVVDVSGIVGAQLSPQAFGRWLFYFSLGSALLLGAVMRRYLRSPAGWALGAIEDREIRVEYLGISANRVLLQAYTLSGFLACCAGCRLLDDIDGIRGDRGPRRPGCTGAVPGGGALRAAQHLGGTISQQQLADPSRRGHPASDPVRPRWPLRVG